MHLDKIKINNFKNYNSIMINFSPEVNFIFGKNGAGKTNLLDAIYYLSYTKSALNTTDYENIKKGKNFFKIEGSFNKKEKKYTCLLNEKYLKKIFENDTPYKKIKDHIGKIPCVFITPYDINLIRGYSKQRRKFIDMLICQLNKNYFDDLITYNKLLKQRNVYLKNTLSIENIDINQLNTYNERLFILNTSIKTIRKEHINLFTNKFNQIFKTLSQSNIKASIEYISNFENKKGIKQYENDFKSDFYSNKTSFGIHNDDYIFKMDNELIKKFGSQGQQKLFIISLKIAEFFMLKFFSKKNPIILLDDVFNKLDDKRINLLLKYFDSNKFSQIFITDSIESRIEKIKTINKKIKIINIKNGIINEQ